MKNEEVERAVDNLSHKKRSRRGIGISKKMTVGIFAVLIAGTLIASAGLLTYYGQVTTTATVSQSILVDGKDYTVPITDSFATTGGCTVCKPHWIKNNACIEGAVSLDTTITGPGGPSGVNVAYYLDEWIDDDNEYNNVVGNVYDDEPYITWAINGDDTIDITFYNPTTWTVVFDYRVDGESGEDWSLTYDTITQGPCDGETWGQKYNFVVINGVGEETVTVEPCYKLEVSSRAGGEQQAYVPWITIERPELTSPFTLQPGEAIDFQIYHDFDIEIIPGTYIITTQFQPGT